MQKIDFLLNEYGIDDKLTKMKVKYGLEIVKSEISKIILFFILFFLIGKTVEYIFVLVLLSPIRSFSGGLHMKTKIGCFVFSIIVYLTAILLLPKINVPLYIYGFCLFISTVIIFIMAPVYTKKRPVKTIQRYKYLRKKSHLFLCIGIVLILMMLILNQTNLFIIGTWILVIQAIQLIIGKQINMKGGVNYEKFS